MRIISAIRGSCVKLKSGQKVVRGILEGSGRKKVGLFEWVAAKYNHCFVSVKLEVAVDWCNLCDYPI